MNCIKLWGRAAVTLILTAASAFAAKVSDVKFDQQGIQQLPAEQLRFNIQLRPGAEFKQEILDEDVKRLFNTGNFADVVSEVKRLPDDQVEVTFKLRLKPRVTRVLFQGNAAERPRPARKRAEAAQVLCGQGVFAGDRLAGNRKRRQRPGQNHLSDRRTPEAEGE